MGGGELEQAQPAQLGQVVREQRLRLVRYVGSRCVVSRDVVGRHVGSRRVGSRFLTRYGSSSKSAR